MIERPFKTQRLSTVLINEETTGRILNITKKFGKFSRLNRNIFNFKGFENKICFSKIKYEIVIIPC